MTEHLIVDYEVMKMLDFHDETTVAYRCGAETHALLMQKARTVVDRRPLGYILEGQPIFPTQLGVEIMLDPKVESDCVIAMTASQLVMWRIIQRCEAMQSEFADADREELRP